MENNKSSYHIILGLHTGCRSGELLGLEWNRVDLQNSRIRLEAKHAKSKKARTVPLNRNAREVLLNRQREQARQSMDTSYVFATRVGSVKGYGRSRMPSLQPAREQGLRVVHRTPCDIPVHPG